MTPDLATLTDSAPYLGNDFLHVGDGKALDISHVGHTTLYSPKRLFTLTNVLRVPHITKPLLSIQKFYRDNHVYFEFHAFMFYVKDLITKEVHLFSQSNDVHFRVFCHVNSLSFRSHCIFATVDLWHRRLSHPTPRILNFLVSSNKITYTSRCSLTQCQACQLGKSSRLSLRPIGHKLLPYLI